jgi:FixJ family two-component response regulator
LLHVVSGQLNKQIAARLGVGLKTIKAHRARVMQKMQTRTVADLVRAALKVGMANADAADGLSGQPTKAQQTRVG